MFPTINHVIKYLTGLTTNLPIPTFGLIMATAFWLAYLAFRSEFKRKEQLGIIHPFLEKKIIGKPASALSLVLYTIVGFITGYKLIFLIEQYRRYTFDISDILFSWRGSWWGGIVFAIAFCTWRYLIKRSQQLPEPVEKEILVHPYEVTDRVSLWCAVVGFIGSVISAKLETLGTLFTDPLAFFTTLDGMTFYGGLIFGAAIFLIQTKKMGISFLTAADIGSPGMALAYAIGRMGCHLSGDGDWGRVNIDPKPGWLSWAPDWLWSFDFPHNVLHQGKYIEGCGDSYCSVLTQPVFPTSFYESTIFFVLFFSLWFSRNKIKRTGQMFFTFMLCNGTERFFIEFIRVNPKHCLLGLCLTQAQWTALALLLLGLGGLIWLGVKRKKELTQNTGAV